MKVLVVRDEFRDYKRGDVISDMEEMGKVLETHSHAVVQSEHPDHAGDD